MNGRYHSMGSTLAADMLASMGKTPTQLRRSRRVLCDAAHHPHKDRFEAAQWRALAWALGMCGGAPREAARARDAAGAPPHADRHPQAGGYEKCSNE